MEINEGTLQFGCVYVYDKGFSERLLSQGYGVKRKRTITKKFTIPSEISSPRGYKNDQNEGAKIASDCSSLETIKDHTDYHNQILDGKNDENSDIAPSDSNNDLMLTEGDKQVYDFDNKQANISKENSNENSNLYMVVLLDEESFYLLVSNKLIITRSQDARTLTQTELWGIFLDKNPKFHIKFKVYSYFRDKGFVVKSGVHFGVDYTLYRSLPSLCHSEMCVLVVDCTRGNTTSTGNTCSNQLPVDQQSLSSSPTEESATRVDNDNSNNNNSTNATHINLLNSGGTPSNLKENNSINSNSNSNTNNSNSNSNQAFTTTAGTGQISWRQISTLTRVIPEVIKLFLTCYVLPVTPPHLSTNSSITIEDFCQSSSPVPAVIDTTTYSCLSELTVHPVTINVRREIARGDGQLSIKSIQKKYRACSQLKRARVDTEVIRKWKDRRDPNSNRQKLQSKFKHIWQGLSGNEIEREKEEFSTKINLQQESITTTANTSTTTSTTQKVNDNCMLIEERKEMYAMEDNIVNEKNVEMSEDVVTDC